MLPVDEVAYPLAVHVTECFIIMLPIDEVTSYPFLVMDEMLYVFLVVEATYHIIL